MTSNQIEKQKADEQKRHQREDERIKEKGINVKGLNDLAGNLVKARGDSIKGATGIIKYMNDPSWYNLNKQSVQDVARFSFGTPLGSANADEIWSSSGTSASVLQLKTPGVMAIHFGFAPGNTSGVESDAVNVAAKNIYAYVRHANSGSRNYEAVDLMMYLLAMDSAISYGAMLQRIYSVAMEAKSENWYYPKAMLYALGVNPDDIISNLAQLRAYINQYNIRINSFNVPNNLPYFVRHAWLCSTIYKDHEIKRSQVYTFVPDYFFVFDSTSRSGSSLIATSWSSAPGSQTLSQLISYGNNMLDTLIAEEDIGIMSGDILKAYGESAMYRAQEITDSYHIETVFSMEVLSQITNATLNGPVDMNTASVWQTASGIIFQGKLGASDTGNVVGVRCEVPIALGDPSAKTHHGPESQVRVLNLYKDSPEPDEVMVSTRLTNTWSIENPSTETAPFKRVLGTHGTEFTTFADIVFYGAGNSQILSVEVQDQDFVSSSQATGAVQEKNYLIGTVPAFDWAPRIRWNVLSTGSTTEIYSLGYDNMDYANFVLVNDNNLRGLHDVASLSEFGVPVMKSEKPSKAQ